MLWFFSLSCGVTVSAARRTLGSNNTLQVVVVDGGVVAWTSFLVNLLLQVFVKYRLAQTDAACCLRPSNQHATKPPVFLYTATERCAAEYGAAVPLLWGTQPTPCMQTLCVRVCCESTPKQLAMHCLMFHSDDDADTTCQL